MARPREFDEDKAVQRAMELFWDHGFEGTSLGALEHSTGLNRSSLYNTFGGKLELFCKALDAYREGPCRELHRPFAQQRGADALRGYLEGLRAFVRSSDRDRGCLMLNTTLDEGVDVSVRQRANAHFRGLRSAVRRAYAQGLEDGTVDDSMSPEETADWLVTFVRGVLAGAASPESTRALERSIATAAKYLGLDPA